MLCLVFAYVLQFSVGHKQTPFFKSNRIFFVVSFGPCPVDRSCLFLFELVANVLLQLLQLTFMITMTECE